MMLAVGKGLVAASASEWIRSYEREPSIMHSPLAGARSHQSPFPHARSYKWSGDLSLLELRFADDELLAMRGDRSLDLRDFLRVLRGNVEILAGIVRQVE